MGEEEANIVQLSDGRLLAYKEQGVCREMATRSLLVLHGLGSSRLAGMPGTYVQIVYHSLLLITPGDCLHSWNAYILGYSAVRTVCAWYYFAGMAHF